MRKSFKESVSCGTQMCQLHSPVQQDTTQKDMSPQDMLNARMDPIIQQYNSHWGAISNTNLIKDPNTPGQYIINGGSMMTDEEWMWFTSSVRWGGYEFRFIDRNKSCAMSLCTWASQMGMKITCGAGVRGILRPYTTEELENMMKVGVAYTTSESHIPRPIQELEKEPRTINNILSESKTIDEALNNLNNSKDILVKDWCYTCGKFVGSFWGDKKVVLIG